MYGVMTLAARVVRFVGSCSGGCSRGVLLSSCDAISAPSSMFALVWSCVFSCVCTFCSCTCSSVRSGTCSSVLTFCSCTCSCTCSSVRSGACSSVLTFCSCTGSSACFVRTFCSFSWVDGAASCVLSRGISGGSPELVGKSAIGMPSR